MEGRYSVVVLLAILQLVTSSIVADYESDFMKLYENVKTYKSPENNQDFYRDEFVNEGVYGVFDWVVVGAGSGGSAAAARLSEVRGWRVLLLEAGGEEARYSDVPGAADLLQFTPLNWGYRTAPQKRSCLAMPGQKCNIPRGKVLGGTSVLNHMIYTRGHHQDYDRWAAAGNPGWAYTDVLPYFLKLENASSLVEPVDTELHSSHGPLHVEHVRYFSPFTQTFLEANEELGRQVLDYNGHSMMGFSRLQSNTVKGKRCSGNKAYLSQARARRNLVVQTHAFATKVLINRGTKSAYGVQFIVGDRIYKAYAKKEVILSAGAIGSPQLLLLSGIGPKEHLTDLGIPVVADLQVGENLSDRPYFMFAFSSTISDTQKPLKEKIEEFLKGKGSLTASDNVQAIGFLNTKNSSADTPNVEYMFMPAFRDFSKYNAGSTTNMSGITILLQYPKSKGCVKLKSSSPFEHPLVDLNYFDVSEDLDNLVLGIKDVMRLLKTKTMAKYNIDITQRFIPECVDFAPLSDEYFKCVITQTSSISFHLSGSCKMGAGADGAAVVDHRLRVRGVRRLRVIDASVIPFPLSAHINVPVYMIAEKGADMIKEEYGEL